MVQRANREDEQPQKAKRAGHIPAECVVLHVNHQKITNDCTLDGSNSASTKTDNDA